MKKRNHGITISLTMKLFDKEIKTYFDEDVIIRSFPVGLYMPRLNGQELLPETIKGCCLLWGMHLEGIFTLSSKDEVCK